MTLRAVTRGVRRGIGLAAAALGLLLACSPAPMPVSQSTNDPSSPRAPEGVSPLVTDAAAPPRAEAAEAGSEPVVYACPMHPDVTSSKPGQRCPKCDMPLVKKK